MIRFSIGTGAMLKKSGWYRIRVPVPAPGGTGMHPQGNNLLLWAVRSSKSDRNGAWSLGPQSKCKYSMSPSASEWLLSWININHGVLLKGFWWYQKGDGNQKVTMVCQAANKIVFFTFIITVCGRIWMSHMSWEHTCNKASSGNSHQAKWWVGSKLIDWLIQRWETIYSTDYYYC